MSTRGLSSLDPKQELRAAVAGVQGELSRLQDVGGLLASWLTLVKVLNVNPASQLRSCPVCGT